jgi:hypothetical protein
MGMRRQEESARPVAGALLLLAGVASAAAAPLRIAAERPGALCPSEGALTLVSSGAPQSGPATAGRCIAVVPVPDVSDAGIAEASRRVAALTNVVGFVLEIQTIPADESPDLSTRVAFAIKKLSSEARAASPGAEVALDLTAGVSPEGSVVLPSEDLGPYADALVIRPGRGRAEIADVRDRWILAARAPAGSAAGQILALLQSNRSSLPSVTLIGVLAAPDRPLTDADGSSLERLQAYWTGDVSPDPTETKATRADGRSFEVLRFFHAKTLTPILLLPEDSAGAVSITLSGGPFAKAAVENLASGAKRDFDLRGASSLSLDLAKGPLAVVLQPASRPGGETRAAVEVGATRELTAEEIVARERIWDAGQRERTASYIALMDASLRFRVADVNETFDLTIEGDYFFRRGQEPDWAWRQFYLNGVKWKGRTLPKLPILEPQKVTTLPLDIRLTEDYAYELEGRSAVGDRPAYEITFRPRDTASDRPIYRGTVWVDVETFALLRRNAIQLNLKGETLSNIQDEYYRPVPGRPDVCLPLLIRGQQVFSTAGRTTAIERNVTMTQVEINPDNFQERLSAAYASKDQMVRDTDHGLRYLIPDPAKPGERMVEEKFSRRGLFGLVGGYYDNSLDYPIPLLGAQYFNFDLWGKGKQLSVFFGGVLLTANYTDPALFDSRFDLGADLFGQAIPFAERIYVEGRIVPGETVKHLTEFFQVNVGHPLGPYLKASLGVFSNWNNYQRDSDTAPGFVVPVDHFTNGAELRLVANYLGFNAALTGTYAARSDWQFWGLPGNPDYSPNDKDYWKWAVELSKDLYFTEFRKLHLSVSYLDGSHLDRFSAYQFGTFSSHPLHGFSSSGPLADTAAVMNIAYGLNIQNLIRLEGFYDQGLLWNPQAGWTGEYFSGAGLLASWNGPLQNSIIRAEVGVPVVSHGIHGVVVFLTLLKLF